MNEDELEAARLRAYQIWEREGRPEGQHEVHWQQALAELGFIDPVEADRGAIAALAREWDEAEEQT